MVSQWEVGEHTDNMSEDAIRRSNNSPSGDLRAFCGSWLGPRRQKRSILPSISSRLKRLRGKWSPCRIPSPHYATWLMVVGLCKTNWVVRPIWSTQFHNSIIDWQQKCLNQKVTTVYEILRDLVWLGSLISAQRGKFSNCVNSHADSWLEVPASKRNKC